MDKCLLSHKLRIVYGAIVFDIQSGACLSHSGSGDRHFATRRLRLAAFLDRSGDKCRCGAGAVL